MTVEGAWNALKMFEHEGIDPFKCSLPNSKDMTRKESDTSGKFIGFAAGIEKGMGTSDTLNFSEARDQIHKALYIYQLQNYCKKEILQLTNAFKKGKRIIIVEKNVLNKPEDERLNPNVPLCNGWILKEYLMQKLDIKSTTEEEDLTVIDD